MHYFSHDDLGGELVFASPSEAAATRGIVELGAALSDADAVIIGAGAGLSSAAGFSYAGERFERHFADFRDAFGIQDMYSGGFYPFSDPETFWAWWSRHVMINRFEAEMGAPYRDLLALVEDKDYFVITTNVDHQFQLAGFDKDRLFYTQGDYGLFQCSGPCRRETYDNESAIRAMYEQQRGMRIPSELVPRCPHCGRPMAMNLRIDDTFVQDAGWSAAYRRYRAFCEANEDKKVLYWELGVGFNTPAIIKYPFWEAASKNPQARFACMDGAESCAPRALASRSILIDADIAYVLSALVDERDSYSASPRYGASARP